MHLYIDIGIAAIFVIALIIGIIRGFTKQFIGPVCGLIVFVGSIGLTLLIVPALVDAGILNGFSNSATGWFSGEAFTTAVSSKDDLTTVLMSSGFLSILSSENIVTRIWATMSAAQMPTLGTYFGSVCARLITGVVIWIILLLVLKLIFWGVRKGFEKLSKLPVLHTLDKIFGGIWAIVIAYVIIVVFVCTAAEIVVVKFLAPEQKEAFRSILNNSAVYQTLHDTNVIGAYIARLFNVDLTTLTPIA